MDLLPGVAVTDGVWVGPCSRDMSKFAIMHWHYSRRMPMQAILRLGVWENERFVGSIEFAPTTSSSIAEGFTLANTEVCELTRIALDWHDAPVSHIVAKAVRCLRHEHPEIRLIVSYADPTQGHVGIIYQAMNWTYTGEVPSTRYVIFGRSVPNKTVTRRYGTRSIQWLRANVDPNATKVQLQPKHRYLLPIGFKMRQLVANHRQSYPKPIDSPAKE